MVGSVSWLRLPMRWAMALLSSRWPSRSGAIAGDTGLPLALPVCEGRVRPWTPHPGPDILGRQEAVNPVQEPGRLPGGTLPFSSPPKEDLEGMGPQAGGDPDPRRSHAPSVRPPPSRISIPVGRHRCREEVVDEPCLRLARVLKSPI